MRITGGRAKGIPIQSGKSTHVRPATDRIREAIFSSLADRIENATCLDLFAGTGAYGLEALSRGANSCLFVEKDGKSTAAILENLTALYKSLQTTPMNTQVKKMDVLKLQLETSYDLIFIDPPYPSWQLLMHSLASLLPLWLKKNPDSRIICEAPAGQSITISGMSIVKTLGGKKNHDPAVLFYAWEN